jgi:hypothetical protein
MPADGYTEPVNGGGYQVSPSIDYGSGQQPTEPVNQPGGGWQGLGQNWDPPWPGWQNWSPPWNQPTPDPVDPTSMQLPITPPSSNDIIDSLWFTGQQAQNLNQGYSDVVSGTLREAQNLAEESVSRSGASGGLGDRVIAETMMSMAPQIWQAANQTRAQDLNSVLGELGLQNQLFGSVGGQPTMSMADFLSRHSMGEAGLTGSYNPAFSYGMFPMQPADAQRINQQQQRQGWLNNLFNVATLLRALGYLPPGM